MISATQKSKLDRPTLRNIIKRPSAFEEIAQSLEYPVVWLEGSAGSGKSTLINAYLEENDIPCLWYRSGDSDNDLTNFLHSFSQGLSHILKQSKKTLSLLQYPFQLDLGALTISVLNEAVRSVYRPFAFVFDDVQKIENAAFYENIVNFLVDFDLPNIKFIFISRHSAPPVFSRLYARQLVNNVDSTCLTWDSADVKKLFVSLSRSDISDNDLLRITQFSQGWVSGLILLAGLSGDKRNNSHVLSDSNKSIVFDYFASEIFKAVPPNVQEFLMKSSFLPEIRADRDAELLVGGSVHQVLEDLNDKNFFTTRCAHDSKAYTYHMLFKAFLQNAAKAYFPKEVLTKSNIRNAERLYQSGDIDNAIELCLQWNDMESASNLILKHAKSYVSMGQGTRLNDWMTRLGAAAIERDPWLKYWKASCILPYDSTAALPLFEDSFAHFETCENANGMFQAVCGIIESILFSFRGYRRLIPWTEKVGALYRQNIKPVGVELSARLAADMHTAILFSCPSSVELQKWESRVNSLMLLLKITFNSDERVLLGVNVFYQYVWRGEWAKADKLIASTQPSAKESGRNPASFGAWCVMAAMKTWSTGEPLKAKNYVDEGLKSAKESGVHFWDDLLTSMRIYACLTARELDNARELIKVLGAGLAQKSTLIKGHYFNIAGFLGYIEGDFDTALIQLEQCMAESEELGHPYAHEGYRLGLVEVLIARKAFSRAKEQIAISLENTAHLEDHLDRYRCYLLKTHLEMDMDNTSEAIKSMRCAMQLAKEKQLSYHHWWVAENMTRLYTFALKHDIETDFVIACIKLRNLTPRVNLIEYPNWSWQVKVHTIDGFRIHVDGKPVLLNGKSLRKPMGLLKALITLGAWRVDQHKISALMWPDAEGDEAIQSLHTTVHRLRKILGAKAVIVKDGNIGLNPDLVWVDVELVKHYLNKLESITHIKNMASAHQYLASLSKVFKAPYLGNDSDETWVYRLRKELEDRCVRCMRIYIGDRIRLGKLDEALIHLDYMKIRFVSDEYVYRKKIEVLIALGRTAEARAIYQECREYLMRMFKILPSQELASLIPNRHAIAGNE